MTDHDQLKHAAAAKALEFVEDGMKLGLGSGTTAEIFLELLGARVRGGLRIVGAPTSEHTAAIARDQGIPLGDLDDIAPLDLDIDGADETDRALNLIKGGGAALLREKIVASSARRMLVICDGSKLVDRLGRFPVPVEAVAFGHKTTQARLERLFARLGYSATATLRMRDGAVVRTDSGNVIYDCALGPIGDAPALAAAISGVPGVVEHGLFIGIASALIVASPGKVEIIPRKE